MPVSWAAAAAAAAPLVQRPVTPPLAAAAAAAAQHGRSPKAQIRKLLNNLEHIVHQITLPDFSNEYHGTTPPPELNNKRRYSPYELVWSYYKLGWTKLNRRQQDDFKSMFVGSPSLAYTELVLAFSVVFIRILNTIGYILILQPDEPAPSPLVRSASSAHLQWIDFSYSVAVKLLDTYVNDTMLLDGTNAAEYLAVKTSTLEKVLVDVKTFITSQESGTYIRKIDSLSRDVKLLPKVDVIVKSIKQACATTDLNLDGVKQIMKDSFGPVQAVKFNLNSFMSHSTRFSTLRNANYKKLYAYTRNTLSANRKCYGHNTIKNSISSKGTRKAKRCVE